MEIWFQQLTTRSGTRGLHLQQLGPQLNSTDSWMSDLYTSTTINYNTRSSAEWHERSTSTTARPSTQSDSWMSDLYTSTTINYNTRSSAEWHERSTSTTARPSTQLNRFLDV
ncbi:hypothetical protein RRG08_066723 [Elysia crispata]|uniref:Uncharacterized protein n=1 Tax=Elysia crispata TaxID=231223 RepID=A0AAE1B8B9_9GAST|nr:hypothetical protein RRG08_066723 [Elysia crispata]